MEIGLYGIHSTNMDKLNSQIVIKQVIRLAFVYAFVMIITGLLPDRIVREDFLDESASNHTLLQRTADG